MLLDVTLEENVCTAYGSCQIHFNYKGYYFLFRICYRCKKNLYETMATLLRIFYFYLIKVLIYWLKE